LSQRISNSGLAALCRDAEISLIDLAIECDVTRQSMHRWSVGRKPHPRLEARVAQFFGLTVPALRLLIEAGITQTQEDEHAEERYRDGANAAGRICRDDKRASAGAGLAKAGAGSDTGARNRRSNRAYPAASGIAEGRM
jgi:hypothetical protein